MIILNLFSLLKKHCKSLPLEDFTTEALAGILQMDSEFRLMYLNLIGLPKQEIYTIKTQQFYREIRQDCYIDLVLESAHTICFIENKVNSGEGFEQLDRYAMVLQTEFAGKVKHLIYCTKYDNVKNIAKQNLQFKLITWHDIGKLISYDSNNLTLDFYNHLKLNEMTNNYMITPELLAASKKAAEIETVFFRYMEEVREEFWKILGYGYKGDRADCITEKKTQYRNDLRIRNRFANIYRNVVGEDFAYSELIYGVDFENSELFTGFYIEHSHSLFSDIESSIKESLSMVIRKFDEGTEFRFIMSLGDLLNKQEGDQIAINWFKNHFAIIAAYVRNGDRLPWIFLKE